MRSDKNAGEINLEGLFLKKPECHTKELKCYSQRREKVKSFKQERFILNLHYRNVTLRENGWMQVRLETGKPFKRLPSNCTCTCSDWETMRLFNEFARKGCKVMEKNGKF